MVSGFYNGRFSVMSGFHVGRICYERVGDRRAPVMVMFCAERASVIDRFCRGIILVMNGYRWWTDLGNVEIS